MKSATYLAPFIAAGLMLSLTACREAEQNRPLMHTPGVYAGKKDEKLSKQQVEELRARAQNLRGN